jgi:hypothetical protein
MGFCELAQRDLNFRNGQLSARNGGATVLSRPRTTARLICHVTSARGAPHWSARLEGFTHMAQPRRTKHFIDSNVQGSLARRILFHWLAFLAIAFLVSFILQVLTNPFRPLTAHLQDLWWTHGPFLLVMVFLLPVFVVDTIKLSHRFAGPIFSLRRAIREVAAGNPPRKLNFRRRDFWRELAEDYNAMLVRLDVLEDEQREPTADEHPREQLTGSKQG